MTDQRSSHLRLVPNLKEEPDKPQNSKNEALKILLKTVFIGAGVGGGIDVMVAYFPSDLAYMTRDDFVYRVSTAAAVTGLLLPLQEKGLKEGEEPKDYFTKVAAGAIVYAFTTTMAYYGLEM